MDNNAVNMPLALDLHFLESVQLAPDALEDDAAERLRVLLMPWLYFCVDAEGTHMTR